MLKRSGQTSDDEMKAWQELAAPVVDEYINNAGPLGAQLVEAAKKISDRPPSFPALKLY